MERIFYNALAGILKNSYAQLRNFWDVHHSWRAAYETLPQSLRTNPEKQWKDLEDYGVSLILRDDPNFPALLREIPFPPFGLYYRGAPVSIKPKIAIVGTRKATATGLATAEQFATELSQAGLEIVSGLALGIDAAAHTGALEAGGVTIAVLANGLDSIYPRQNSDLHASIIANGGTILSEYPLGQKSYQNQFLERNRIVSGLSLGVLAIEAPERSGTLATARFAVEQNRDVFVVPGAINNTNYQGSHALIQSGAALVTCANDVLQMLELAPGKKTDVRSRIPTELLDEDQKVIVDILASNSDPLHTDEIIAKSELSDSAVNSALATLVISSIIKETGGRYFI